MSPFEALGRPIVMGHRGAPLEATENTPASFAIAAAVGATWVELDARRSADGVPVVHHDAWTADGHPVVELSAADLRDRQVWALADVLAGLPAGLGVDIELKNLPGEPDYDAEDPLVALVAAVVEPVDRPMMTSSFNPGTVVALGDRLPTVPVGLLTTAGIRADAGVELAGDLGVHVYCPHVDTPQLGATTVAAAHDAGFSVLVWTVDDPARATDLAVAGVDALCTNDPRTLAGAMAKGGLASG